MSLVEHFLLSQFAAFMLVLARVGGLVATAPILNAQAAPVRFRALLAVSVSLLLTPMFSHALPADVFSTPMLLSHLARETLLGLLLGFGVALLLSGIQLAGQAISLMGGVALADVFDPATNSNSTIYSQLLYFLTIAMFGILGGHRLVMGALLDTFSWLPPGRATLGESYVDALVTLLTHSFLLGIRAAAPTLTALLLATVVLGLVGRTLPQINILAVGFSVNQVMMLGAMAVSVGAIAWAFPQQIDHAVTLLLDSVRPVEAAPAAP
ncbi:MAG: flagellar biosynthetic protein FliR [Planctomycetota bacterium]